MLPSSILGASTSFSSHIKFELRSSCEIFYNTFFVLYRPSKKTVQFCLYQQKCRMFVWQKRTLLQCLTENNTFFNNSMILGKVLYDMTKLPTHWRAQSDSEWLLIKRGSKKLRMSRTAQSNYRRARDGDKQKRRRQQQRKLRLKLNDDTSQRGDCYNGQREPSISKRRRFRRTRPNQSHRSICRYSPTILSNGRSNHRSPKPNLTSRSLHTHAYTRARAHIQYN